MDEQSLPDNTKETMAPGLESGQDLNFELGIQPQVLLLPQIKRHGI